jgi:hypothetical protein
MMCVCVCIYIYIHMQGAEKEAPDRALAFVPKRRLKCSGGAPGEHVCVCVYVLYCIIHNIYLYLCMYMYISHT